MAKTYVLDTNVLLTDPRAIYAFQENHLIIPLIVLEELDKHKSRPDGVGRNARQANRELDELRKIGSLTNGITLDSGGTLRVATINPSSMTSLPIELNADKADNVILAFMLDNKGAVLVSKDINVRVKCDALGLKSEDYLHLRPASSPDQFYTGVDVREVSHREIENFYADRPVFLSETSELYPNQIIVIKSVLESGETQKSALAKFIKQGEPLKPLLNMDDVFGLKPRNKEQKFVIDLLFDDSIKLVTLSGRAGVGKTLLALACGLEQMKGLGKHGKYQKMIVSRPVQTMGNDIGFLPGTLKEKLDPWIAPIRDNLNFLLGVGNTGKTSHPRRRNRSQVSDEPYLEMLQENGLIEVEALAYIRGRSIPNSYILIDESQNLSIHELKTIITRAGEGTKIVLTGDLEQIDNVHLDIFSNGLTHAIERFKSLPVAGHVSLVKGCRSELASIAAEIL